MLWWNSLFVWGEGRGGGGDDERGVGGGSVRDVMACTG